MKKYILLIALSLVITSCSQGNDNQSISKESHDEKKTFKWTMVTTWAKNYPGLGMAAENLSKYVEEMSNGRLKIKVYGQGELVPPMGVFDAVSQGNVEMGHGASYYWIGKIKSAQFFTAVPFGLTAQEMNGWLHYGGGL